MLDGNVALVICVAIVCITGFGIALIFRDNY